MKRLREQNKVAAAGGLEPGGGAGSSDAELVRAAWRGDKQAFVEIVARHQAMVCGIALGIVGNLAASEDAGQEAFLTAWRKIHELREPERLRAWLRQIARHAALGYQRRLRGHDALEEVPDLPDRAPAPDEHAASEEEAALVRAALAQLPEIYREPLILYYRESHSTKAVAEALEISEEAVRQRLARGREMLREQISDVIESVLTRTGPTSIFTMTVAVAIGALAAPSVVAGGVFTAAAAGKASMTAGRGALLNALKASKATFFVAVVATFVSIPVGYQLRLRLEPRASGAVSATENSVMAARAEAPAAFESSAIFAEWKRLHDTHGTNVDAMPNIYREIARFGDSLRRRGFRAALIAEWVQLDPTNAMAAFRGRTIDAGQRRQFIDEWLARDAAMAVDGLMASGRGWEPTVRELLPELARRAPARVAVVAAKLPRPDSGRDARVREAFAIVAEQGIDAARGAAEAMPAANREQALAGVAQTWGKRDLDGALNWASKLPEGTERDEVMRAALVGAAAVAPVSALERVGSISPGGRKGYFASTTGARVLKEAALADFDGTVSWMATHPGRLGEEDLMGLAGAVAERLNAEPRGFLTQYAEAGSLFIMLPAVGHALFNESSGQRGAVWDWVQNRSKDAITLELRTDLLRAAGQQDTAMAFRFAADLPATAEGDSQRRLLADNLLGDGARLHRLDTLLEQAPESLRQPLLASAFEHLRSDTLYEPQRWLARLSQLPEGERGYGAEMFAGAWAEQMPDEAIGWAASMPAGEERARAKAGIASGWAANDAPAASAWVAAMSAGPERDRSAQALVAAMAEEYPREAWDWALSIDDGERRAQAAAYAVRTMGAQDFAMAREWLERSPFTPEEKALLQLVLETLNQRRAAP